jgi:putative hydrolase of HD superfamily
VDRDAVRRVLLEAVGLKDVTRAGWARRGVAPSESVAAHSWGVAWLALVLCPAGVDRGRALAIALVHDLAEVRVGDLTPHDGVPKAEKHRREVEALSALVAPLPNAAEIAALWAEYAAGATPEARLVRACDKLDMALQAQRYAQDRGADTRELIDSALEHLTDADLRALAGGV